MKPLAASILLLAACASPDRVAESIRVEVGTSNGGIGVPEPMDGGRDYDTYSTYFGVSWSPFDLEREPVRQPEPPPPVQPEPQGAGALCNDPASSDSLKPPPETTNKTATDSDGGSPLTLKLFGKWTTGDVTTLLVLLAGAWKSWQEGRCYIEKRKARARIEAP